MANHDDRNYPKGAQPKNAPFDPRDPRTLGSREGAENSGGYDRDSGFTRERGFGHTPGQRWGNGLSANNANVERTTPTPPVSGRGFPGSVFGAGRPEPNGYGARGSDMGMGAPEDDRGPHYGKGPKGYVRTDARTLEDVCEAIAEHGYVDATEVEVKVKDGIATLSGTVAHRHDKKVLEALVERIRGVEEVHNEIRIPRPDRNRPQAQEATGAGASHTMEGRELSDERIPDERTKSVHS